MKLVNIIDTLRKEGHVVEVRKRADGGVIVISIDGKRYSGAKGNAKARELVGASLSEAQKVQLETIKPPKGKSPQKRKLPSIDEQLKKKYRRVQRLWKKHIDPKQGKITKKKLRWNIEHLGAKRTMEKLEEAERYALGLAYSENISHLVDYIRMTSQKAESLRDRDALLDLADLVEENAHKIREETILPAYHELYKINDGVSVLDVVRETKRILNI